MVNGSIAVLLIDDDEKFQKSFSDMLQETGFIVSVADKGEKALEAFSPDPNYFDLVVLDLLMPDVDGSEIYELLRLQNPNVEYFLHMEFSILTISWTCQKMCRTVLFKNRSTIIS